MDQRIQALANLLVNYSADVQPGNKVVIQGEMGAAPLLKEVYRSVLLAGGFPFITVDIPGTDYIYFKHATDEQLDFIHDPIQLIYEKYDRFITILGEQNTRNLNGIDPQRMTKRSRATEALLKTFLGRAGRGEMKWTLSLFPTEAYAQDAEMSLEEYEEFVYSATMPDTNDPVGYWKKVSARQEQVVEWLRGRREVHITAPETDLRLRIDDRRFINCDCHENVPDGEIFTGPVEDSVEGQVYFSYPAIFGGREVTGVRLWFENGRVIRATADKNEDYLLATIDTDPGGRYVGEFAIGTNEGIQRFTRNILFDEKIGGSFHMALGAGYPETGSKNESAIHWDMICDLREGGKITVDGDLVYQDGCFTLDFHE